MSVHYKFKSTLDYDTVSFDGLHISVGDLKKAIFHQKRIGKNTDFDLQITNAQTKEDYNDDNALIAKNTSLIVARVPLTVQQKKSWDRNEAVPFGNSKEEAAIGRGVDLTRLDGSEEDKIRAMMTQSTQDYDPSNYMKIRGANQTGEVPTNYRCFRCHQPGHWIKNCPLGSNQEPIEIKKSTGIPRSFMVPVDGPSVPGAMMTPTGHYAVPVIDHQAYKEGKKERPPFSQDPDPVVEKPEIPDDLLCNICKDLMTDAVMIPCCGNSFCDECIRTFLLESEDHECPDCADKDNSPETLIPNRFLRNAVLNFKNETGYAKRPIFRPPKIQSEITAEPTKLETAASQEKIVPSQTDAPILSQESVEKSPTEIEASPKPVVKPALSTMIAESASATSASATAAATTTTTTTVTTPAPAAAPEPEIPTDSTKLHADDESEVPPPPGTEPLLPIPSGPDTLEHDKKEIEEDYPRERHHRERRAYNRDAHRERQSHHGDYQNVGSATHMMPQQHSKSYSNHPGSDGHYQHHMHYDSGIRRSTEDRAGTPTVDEPHLHQPPATNQQPLLPFPPGDERVPTTGYNPPPSNMVQHNPPLLPDPYMGHRVPMYPPHQQQGPQYPPPQRYERPPYSQYGGARSAPIPRGYTGPPRPARGMMNPGYRGIQPPPPGLGRNIHNGGQGVIDDPLEAFERMLREKDERDRRMGKHRRRTRSRSRSRSYTRSRSRSFGRRSPTRMSRSRSPPSKRRSSRSPPPLRRSRTPIKRRSRSGSFSMSRSRSFSRSQSPRGSIPRDRERDRDRDGPPRYRSPARSPPRFHRDRERDRPKSRDTREPFNTYYNDPPNQEYSFRDRDRDLPPRDRPLSHRYPPRNQVQHNAPSMMPPIAAGGHPPIMPMGHPPPDRKDYYDSYNRYPAGPSPARYNNSPHREHTHKRFDDVAPPGTEGYYDLPPPGVDHLERPTDRLPREPASKNQELEDRERGPPRDDRVRDREDRLRERDDRDRPAPIIKERDDRNREKDDRDRRDKDRDEKMVRRDDDRQFEKRDYEKERFRDERDRHRMEDKGRMRDRDRDRRERDYEREKDRERHERYEKSFVDRKKKRTPSPYISKSRSDLKDVSPERSRKKDRDHEEKPEEKKKEKKIKDKKKKKDSEEKEKKKKKKKEKKLIQKEALKEEQAKASEATANEIIKTEEEKAAEASALLKVENIKPEESQEIPITNESSVPSTEEFDEKSLAINPEPPETEIIITSPKVEESEPGSNPPNPNFKPIPELKAEIKNEIKAIDSLYSGLDDTEINTVITEKYTILPENETEIETEEQQPTEIVKSPKKDEFLAPVPEISKWERDETNEKTEVTLDTDDNKRESDEIKDNKVVTSEVLKRAENAIFQKAINAIRPIEIKKISESRKILYQNPEPKILEVEPPREQQQQQQQQQQQRKNVNVTINVGKNERNVEISEPTKKAKLDRSKFKPVLETHSPTRLSAKERLGDKVEDDKERKPSPKILLRETKIETRQRSRSPRLIRERRLSPCLDDKRESLPLNPERKVFLEERKRIDRPKERNNRSDMRPDLRTDLRASKIERERERDRTPPIMFRKIDIPKPIRKDEEIDKEKEKRKEKKREEKKRKKEHRSRSKSKDRKKKKEKKHKKDKEKHLDKKQKHKEKMASIEKIEINEQVPGNSEIPSITITEDSKKQRKNPRLVSDRKRSVLDEANFEPDYSASESESETEEKTIPVKKVKLDESQIIVKETDKKKRIKSISSDDESSSTETTSTDSESSDESHKKRKKKHKKHKKKKSIKKETSSDSDSYSDSSDSSTEEERHRKKSKKYKKSKQKKKKKSKHK